MLRSALLVAAFLLAGCAAPRDPTSPPTASGPSDAPATPMPHLSPSSSEPPSPPAATPLREPTWLPEENRTFALALGARDATHHLFLVNATERALVTLFVRSAEPAPRGFGATVLASGPNGTRQQDSGLLEEGGAAFALRLAPLGLSAEKGPALLRVRVSATVPVLVEGRVAVDDEVPMEGGSTVP